MTVTKQERKSRPGIPMSEEELKEWKKTFTDIQENIDSLMGEENGRYARPDSRQICKADCEEGNAEDK